MREWTIAGPQGSESLFNDPGYAPSAWNGDEARSAFNHILTGDATVLLNDLPPSSVDLSFWSPPYYVGKSYERHLTFDEWKDLIKRVIACHKR